MKTILYVGRIGSAMTALHIHTHNIAKIMRLADYNVVFLTYRTNQAERYESIDGFEYYYVDESNKKIPGVRAIQQIRETLYGTRLYAEFKRLVHQYKPSGVVLYGFYAEEKIFRYCKKHALPFYIERCDWFEKDHYTNWLSRELFYPREEKLRKELDAKADGVIAISPYLYDYYKQYVNNTILLPPVFPMDENDQVGEATPQGRLRLVYAGMMGKTKDVIWPAVEAAAKINADEIKIEFDIVGPNEAFLAEMAKSTGTELKGIRIHGRQDHSVTEKIVQSADFSVLLREAKRYAIAGFSTKFAESMMLGVPVICNAVGGADTVITNMQDGVVIAENSTDSLRQILEKLLDMTKEQKQSMKWNARKYAVSNFTIDQRVEMIKTFMEAGASAKGGNSK